MRRKLIFFLLFGLIFYSFAQAYESKNGLKWGGYLQLDHRLFTKTRDYSFKEYRLDLQAEYKTSENSKLFSEIWIRSLGFSSISSSQDLFFKEKISPVDINVREAYLDIYGFLTKNLDIRIGRQRIAWGTADKINPTDNINPDDLEDIWDMGRHLGSDGLKATYYLKNLTIQGVFILNFTPAAPPLQNWVSAFIPPIDLKNLGENLQLRSIQDRIIMPKNNLKENMIAGLKLSTNISGYDFSLSYLYGREDLPIANVISVENITSMKEVDVLVNLIYPRTKVIGADFSGSIGEIGIWGEAGFFFPEEVKLKNYYLSFFAYETTSLSDKPYLKYALGLDYTFKNGIYINTQFIHGFIHERGNKNLNDYITMQLEWKLLNERLKLIPISGAIEIKDKNNYTFVYNPFLEYRPFENTTLSLGARIINGKGTTNFGRLKEMDEIWIKAKYSF